MDNIPVTRLKGQGKGRISITDVKRCARQNKREGNPILYVLASLLHYIPSHATAKCQPQSLLFPVLQPLQR